MEGAVKLREALLPFQVHFTEQSTHASLAPFWPPEMNKAEAPFLTCTMFWL